MESDLDPDLLKEFLEESQENLDQVDRDLVLLEENPADSELISSVFRTMHSIKGASSFLELPKLGALTHHAEELLSALRDETLRMNTDIAGALLSTVDTVRGMLDHIQSTSKEPAESHEALETLLSELADPSSAKTKSRQPTAGATPASSNASTAPTAPKSAPPDTMASSSSGDSAAPEPSSAPGKSPPAPSGGGGGSNKRKSGGGVSETSVRVDIALLDKLMNLVGELVLARNQLVQLAAKKRSQAFLAPSQRLNLVTTELQEEVMKTRMQPINNVWSKVPRLVRDVAASCNKRVRVVMEGKETELDRTILDAIKDPLTHIIRNAVDHGLEEPHVRTKRGKPPGGTIALRAFHEGGHVNIEVSDDGGGLNPERLIQRALERGLITPEQADRLTPREAMSLIFRPGFSTAASVTSVSGRGVGMDVVKTNIERIGGTVDLSSTLRLGTSIKLKIPLTLAIIPALIVTSGGERFAIPQVSLIEFVRLDSAHTDRGIEYVGGAPVHRLRGKLLPLVYLNEVLCLPDLKDKDANIRREGSFFSFEGDLDEDDLEDLFSEEMDKKITNIIVLQSDGQHFGLVVDSVNDTEEIVVKPLSKQLKSIPALAGATIRGDGRIALILDVLGIAQEGLIMARSSAENSADGRAPRVVGRGGLETFLLVSLRPGDIVVIPLADVARIEEVTDESIEYLGHIQVVQYRGEILPLVKVSDILGDAGVSAADLNTRTATLGSADKVSVVVYQERGISVGFVVQGIVDIASERIDVRSGSQRPGVSYSTVIRGRITEIIDVDKLLDNVNLPTLRSLSSEAAVA
jgi:two-component system chemotaxis sensor kinase CheA